MARKRRKQKGESAKPSNTAVTGDAAVVLNGGDAPSLVIMLLAAGAWFAVFTFHFLCCARLAWWLGSPGELPSSWQTVDELFSHGISGTLHVILIAVWFAVVFLVLLPFLLVGKFIGSYGPPVIADAVWPAFLSMLPILIVTALTLLILPMYSHVTPEDPTGLELAEVMTFGHYLSTLYSGLFALTAILVLFVGLLLGAMFFEAVPLLPDMLELIAAILIGIVLSITFGMLAGPAVLSLEKSVGAVRAIVIYLAVLAVVMGLPTTIVVWSGQGKK